MEDVVTGIHGEEVGRLMIDLDTGRGWIHYRGDFNIHKPEMIRFALYDWLQSLRSEFEELPESVEN